MAASTPAAAQDALPAAARAAVAAPARRAAPPPDPSLSLFQLLDPAVMADPYPFYHRLRVHDPVHWDPFMHTWLVTGYADAVTVLRSFSADRTPRTEQLGRGGLDAMAPMARVMSRQMLFLDPPEHTRLHKMCAAAFTRQRIERLRERIQAVADELLDAALPSGRMDVIGDFAGPLPAIVTAELLGVPREDHRRIKAWSEVMAEMIGSSQHNPDRVRHIVAGLEGMTAYFQAAMRAHERQPGDGLLGLLMDAEVDGARLSEEEILAMTFLLLVGAQETTTNLIATGLLTLLRAPEALAQLRDDPAIINTAVEELLRHVSPTQATFRIAPEDCVLGGKAIRRGDTVTPVLAAANRDPARFPDPDRLDLTRPDNRHLAFGWSTHFCLGAPLARMEGAIALTTLLRRLPGLALADAAPRWREILVLRGLTALAVTFDPGNDPGGDPGGNPGGAPASAEGAA